MRFEIMLFERSHVCGRFIDGEPSHWEPPLIWTGEGRIGGAKRIAALQIKLQVSGVRGGGNALVS